MVYLPYPTGTLLIPSGPGDLKHLFVVVTNKCKDDLHLLFSISSIRPGVAYDDTCVFDGGEHDFIRHRSYVYYRKPDQRRASSISRMVELGAFTVKPDLAEIHFVRICEGVSKSKFSTPATVKYFVANVPLLD
jgi:hypothetical protein